MPAAERCCLRDAIPCRLDPRRCRRQQKTSCPQTWSSYGEQLNAQGLSHTRDGEPTTSQTRPCSSLGVCVPTDGYARTTACRMHHDDAVTRKQILSCTQKWPIFLSYFEVPRSVYQTLDDLICAYLIISYPVFHILQII